MTGRDARRALMQRVAEMYYEHGQTMDEIAGVVDVSRATVSRLIGDARASGLVEITVHRDTRAASVLERLVAERFAVDTTVVGSPRDLTGAGRALGAGPGHHLATEGARRLRALLEPDSTVAVAWGTTVGSLARALPPSVVPGLRLVQMSGSGNTFSSGTDYASGVLDHLGGVLGARVHHLPVPAFFDRPSTRAAVFAERSIQRVVRLQQHAAVAVFSVGALAGPVPGHLYRAGYLSREELSALAAQGVVGDVGTQFLRADGSSEGLAMNQRSSGLAVEALRALPRRLCVAGGADKEAVLRAALLAGLVTDLVVDVDVAELLAGD